MKITNLLIITIIFLTICISFQNCSNRKFSSASYINSLNNETIPSSLSSHVPSTEQRPPTLNETTPDSNSDDSPNSHTIDNSDETKSVCEGRHVNIYDIDTKLMFAKGTHTIQIAPDQMAFFRFRSPSLSQPKMGKDGAISYVSSDSPQPTKAPPSIVIGLSNKFCNFTKSTYSATPTGALHSEGLAAYLVSNYPTLFDTSFLTMQPNEIYYLQIKTVQPQFRAYVEFMISDPIEKVWFP